MALRPIDDVVGGHLSLVVLPEVTCVQSILDLAEANGLTPDYSCRSGVCQTCMSDLQEGEVEYVLEPLDPPDPGSVLICCSKPKTNVIVDV
ncbi:MAG: 2Fe-2S iron-sulfur cluster binding domain-containing protein [Acidobacteria bacterium]|nr:2Fe-2S iron-sulfur cluster binding domain-containing protein [Candidatus Sulfomarinibacter kjeldsenii]